MRALILVFIASVTFASLPIGNINNVSAKYNSPAGIAQADYINIEGMGEYVSPKLDVVNNSGVLVFSFEEKSFEIDLSLFAVQDAQKVEVKNLNLINDKQKINLNFSSILASDILTDAKIHDVKFDCKRTQTHDDMLGDLFETCFTNADIFLKRFDYYSEASVYKNFIDDKVSHTDIVVKNITINVNDKMFKGSLESNLTFGIDVRFDGGIKYYPEERMVELRVDNVRASLFSIRSKIFKELHGKVPDNIVVEEPYIKIYIP